MIPSISNILNRPFTGKDKIIKMDLNTTRILIIDDSLPMRIALQQSIRLEGLKSVKTAGSFDEAENIIREFSPDCVVVDTSLPGIVSGESLKKLRSLLPVPVITIGSSENDLQKSVKAGASAYVKIGVPGEKKFSDFCDELCAAITKTVNFDNISNMSPAHIQNIDGKTKYNIIAIGASTGGTEATAQVLTKLPSNIPGIVIVQHMPAGFTRMYAERLDKITALNVREAKDGDRVERGSALVAEGGKHMRLAKDSHGYFVKCSAGERVNGHCPSVGVLFGSVAQTAGADAIGVILTGMGSDGAAGLLEMRKAGAYTIGQDKNSSVVYGMPMVAYEKGAVIRQAPLGAIPGIILGKLKH